MKETMFYMNVVGCKGFVLIQRNLNEEVVLYERSGM